MLRTAANRAGCVFWSASESRTFVSHPNDLPADRWSSPVPARTPSPTPPPAPQASHTPQRPDTPRASPHGLGWPARLLTVWRWLQSWLPFWHFTSAAAAAPSQAASPPASPAGGASAAQSADRGVKLASQPTARDLAAARLASHPIPWGTEADQSESEAGLPLHDAAAMVADLCREGADVAPLTAPRTPPAGLRVGFEFTRAIAAPMHAIAEVICDSDRGSAWIDRCVESRLIAATSTGPIAYHRYRLPFVGDRDAITRSTLEARGADTIKITVQPWESAEVAQPRGTVRLPWVEGSFTLVAQTPELTRVCHASQLVLGGRIPGFLAPMIRKLQNKSPDVTLRRLAALVEPDPATD